MSIINNTNIENINIIIFKPVIYLNLLTIVNDILYLETDYFTKKVYFIRNVYRNGTLYLIEIIHDSRRNFNKFPENQQFAYNEYIWNVQYAEV